MISKLHTLLFRPVNRDSFEMIKNGLKKIETRAAIPEYQRIKKGDQVRFVCGSDECIKSIKKATVFPSMTAMLRRYNVHDTNPTIKTATALRKRILSFPGYKERLKKYGIIVFELG